MFTVKKVTDYHVFATIGPAGTNVCSNLDGSVVTISLHNSKTITLAPMEVDGLIHLLTELRAGKSEDL